MKDGRELFGINRKKKSKISFSFDSENRLIGIGAYFDKSDMGQLMTKLNTQFGQPIDSPSKSQYSLARWKDSRDSQLELSLTMIPKTFGIDILFSIAIEGLRKPKVAKEDLGF